MKKTWNCNNCGTENSGAVWHCGGCACTSHGLSPRTGAEAVAHLLALGVSPEVVFLLAPEFVKSSFSRETGITSHHGRIQCFAAWVRGESRFRVAEYNAECA